MYTIRYFGFKMCSYKKSNDVLSDFIFVRFFQVFYIKHFVDISYFSEYLVPLNISLVSTYTSEIFSHFESAIKRYRMRL